MGPQWWTMNCRYTQRNKPLFIDDIHHLSILLSAFICRLKRVSLGGCFTSPANTYWKLLIQLRKTMVFGWNGTIDLINDGTCVREPMRRMHTVSHCTKYSYDSHSGMDGFGFEPKHEHEHNVDGSIWWWTNKKCEQIMISSIVHHLMFDQWIGCIFFHINVM